MWIIRYSNHLEEGQLVEDVRCLRNDKVLTIGRSSKNDICIKNDKSISRQHVSLEVVEGSNNVVLKNYGKVTLVKGRYLTVGESFVFENVIGDFTIDVGTKPIVLHLINHQISCNFDSGVANDVLLSYGVQQKETVYPNTIPDFYLLESNNDFMRKCMLFLSLTTDRELINQQQLHDYCNDNLNVFEQKLSRLESKNKHDNFKQLQVFIETSSQKELDYINIALKFLNAKCYSYIDDSDLKVQAENHNIKSFVLIDSEELTKTPKLHNYSYTSIEDCIDAFKKNTIIGFMKINQLQDNENSVVPAKRELHKVLNTDINGLTPTLEPKPKKKRLQRNKVQPLSSLNFFAGGGNISKADDDIIENERKADDERMTQSFYTADNNLISPELPKKIKTQPTLKILDSKLTEGVNISKNSKKLEIERSNKTLTSNDNADSYTALTNLVDHTNRTKFDEQPEVNSNQSQKEIIIDSQSASNFVKVKEEEGLDQIGSKTFDVAKKNISKNLVDANKGYDSKKSQTGDGLVHAIQEVKNREVKRVQSSVVKVEKEELTDEALAKLGDLTLVVPNEHLIKRKSISDSPLVSTRELEHNGINNRKNFKNFVKIIPKYKQNDNERNLDFVRNSGRLLTKNYVPFESYKGDSRLPDKEMMFEFPEETLAELNSIGNNKTQSQADILQASDSQIDAHLNYLVPKNPLFVQDADEDIVDDSEADSEGNQGNVFEAEKFNNNDLGTTSNTSSKASLQKDYSDNYVVQKSRLANFKRPDFNDNDDDDDDTPKFKFRRNQ